MGVFEREQRARGRVRVLLEDISLSIVSWRGGLLFGFFWRGSGRLVTEGEEKAGERIEFGERELPRGDFQEQGGEFLES